MAESHGMASVDSSVPPTGSQDAEIFKRRIQCPMCGRSFYRTPHGKSTKRFCSSACKARFRRFHENGLRIGEEWVICKNCPNRFRKKRKDHIFCSTQCLRTYHRHGYPNYERLKTAMERSFAKELERNYQEALKLQKYCDDLNRKFEEVVKTCKTNKTP